MEKISNIQAVQQAAVIRPLTEINERECLARLAMEVESDGLIVEIGTLYGGMTGVLALANPKARIITIDNFSWHPADDVETSEELLYENMEKIGAKNVTCITADSLELWKTWVSSIDLLWIDGGHSYKWVYSDLSNFGPFAQVIALHDYNNPFWKTIKQAIDDFLSQHPEWALSEIVGTVAVLKRLGSIK